MTYLEGRDDTLQDPETLANGVGRVEHGLLRLLKVLVVRSGETLEGGEESREL